MCWSIIQESLLKVSLHHFKSWSWLKLQLLKGNITIIWSWYHSNVLQILLKSIIENEDTQISASETLNIIWSCPSVSPWSGLGLDLNGPVKTSSPQWACGLSKLLSYRKGDLQCAYSGWTLWINPNTTLVISLSECFVFLQFAVTLYLMRGTKLVLFLWFSKCKCNK